MKIPRKVSLLSLAVIFLSNAVVAAQAPPSIQFFMPGGGLPGRPLRFTLTPPDGIIEILFTDTKGKFLMTGNLLRDGDYTLIIESDKRTFDTTIQRFRMVRGTVSYLPVFLRPLRSDALPKATVDVADYDAKASTEARAAYEEAMKAVNQNDAEAAISEFTRALTLYPQYLRALNDLGVLYLKLNRLDEAAATFTQAISLNGRFYFPRLNLGLVLNRQGRYTEAVEVLRPLVKEQPTLTQARVLLSDSLLALQQWDEAEQQLREALKDDKLDRPTQAEAHQKLGLILNQKERYEAAVAALEKAIALNPDAAMARLYLGAAFLQLKKLPDAERELLKAYQVAGKSVATAQFLLGQLYYNQQKYELGLRAFEQYLADVPTAPNAAQIRDVIEKLKATMKPK